MKDNLPDKDGFFGEYGGKFVPETLMYALNELEQTYKTLKDNNLRVLKDGCILNSQACLLISKKKAATLRPFLNSLI